MKADDVGSRLPRALDRRTLAGAIAGRLRSEQDRLRANWLGAAPFEHVVIDDLLPASAACELSAKLPPPGRLPKLSSHRQRKRIGVDLEQYDPAIGELLFAFQQPEVVEAVEHVTGFADMAPDPSFYASGLSVMVAGDFVNPHLDNSHNGEQSAYRVLNLLYYLSADWALDQGGSLQLWDKDVRHPTTVLNTFNRLVLMKTDNHSWHSVTQVASSRPRWCVSNYYFSSRAPGDAAYRHVSTFAGRPDEKGKRILLALDGLVANALGKIFPALVRRNKHRRTLGLHERG